MRSLLSAMVKDVSEQDPTKPTSRYRLIATRKGV
jgi:hypothetical protein